MNIDIQNAPWERYEAALKHIRDTVFVREQGVPEELEWDGLDPQCEHFLATGPNGGPIGCARLHPEGKVGRMAVLESWRKQGVGTALLKRILATARERDMDHLSLNAQLDAMDFYARFGFRPRGDEFLDAGIPHRKMVLTLSSGEAAGPKNHPPAGKLGETDGVIELLDAGLTREVCLGLVSRARRSVWILSRELDPALFDNAPFCDALAALTHAGPHSHARILVQQPANVLRYGHRLLDTLQRLTSKIEVRRPARQHSGINRAVLLADNAGYVDRLHADRYEGRASFNAPREVRELRHWFNGIWEQAAPANELRRL